MHRIARLITGVAEHWLLVVTGVVLLSLLAFLSLAHLRIENDLMFMLPEENPVKIFYQDMEEKFGNSAGIAIAVASPRSIGDPDLLRRIQHAGDWIQQANLRIPAAQIGKIASLPSEPSLVLTAWLQAKRAESASLEDIAAETTDVVIFEEALSDTFPYFLPPASMKELCEGTARAVSEALSTRKDLLPRMLAILDRPTDRRGRIQELWVDKVISLADVHTVWPEFVDRAPLHALLEAYGLPLSLEMDLFLDKLLEGGACGPEELVRRLKEEDSDLTSPGMSPAQRTTLAQTLTPERAEALLQAIQTAPKQIRVGPLYPKNLGEALSDSERTVFLERLRSWPLFEGTLRSNDEKSTLLLIRTAPNLDKANRALLLDEVHSALHQAFHDSPYQVHLAGEPVIDEEVATLMMKDVIWLLPVVIGVVAAFLAFSFQSLAGVLYPMLTVLLSLLWCVGAMALLDVPISVVSTVLPVLMVAVGSAYGIHLVHHMARRRLHSEHRLQNLQSTLQVAGKGVLMAGMTTIAGFASLGFNRIVPLRDFGLFIALGIFFSLVISFSLIPALLLRWGGEGRTGAGKHWLQEASGRLVARLSLFSSRHAGLILGACLVVCGVSLAGMTALRVEVNNITFFKESAPVRQADAFMNEHFAGTVSINTVFEGKEPLKALDPAFLKTMDQLGRELERAHPQVGKSVSISEFIKKMNQTFWFNTPGTYRLPALEELEGDKSLEALVNHQASFVDKYNREDTRPYLDEEKCTAVLSTQIKTASSTVVMRIMEDISNRLAGDLGEPLRRLGISFQSTGVGGLYVEANQLIVFGQLRSIAVSLLIVLILISLIMKSLYVGLLAIVPLSATILFNFGLMGFLGIPLDVGTAITACIAIGIGVDYSIHYLNRYRLVRQEGLGHGEALQETALSSGQAIFINALAVTSGFLVLLLSSFVPLIHLGALISVTMVSSALGSVTLIPAALAIRERWSQSRAIG